MNVARALAVCLLFALANVAAADEAPPEPAVDSVTTVVFGAELMADIEVPVTLRYRYEMHGRDIAPRFESHADMMVENGAAPGQKSVNFDMFEGADRRLYGPLKASTQNPMILVFLQRDVQTMAGLTGGAANYFQQQLRRAFNRPAAISRETVEHGDQSLQVTRAVLVPYAEDPSIDRFPQFRDKVYEFWVTPELPGGLYRIATRTPDVETGEVILEESLTFERALDGD
jgi:hypothetical protein